jgi:hypothetical protein
LPERKQQFLKVASGVARAEIVSAKLFAQFFVAVYDLMPTLDARF